MINLADTAAERPWPAFIPYCASKAAVVSLTRSFAKALAPRIRVNVIAPSLTNTPLAASLLSSEERAAAAAKRHPLNRVGDRAEVAGLVEFLIRSDSGFVTG